LILPLRRGGKGLIDHRGSFGLLPLFKGEITEGVPSGSAPGPEALEGNPSSVLPLRRGGRKAASNAS
jgi:hypothetical protein